jgi:DNA-binding PadR family transcriptional regulator
MTEVEILLSAALLLLDPEVPQNIGDIQERAVKDTKQDIPYSTVSAALQRMKDRGIVKRVVTQDERRRSRIQYQLTKKGHRRVELIGDLILRALAEAKNGQS